MTLRPLLFSAALIALSSACMGHTRTFSTPLTSAEGTLVVPAIISTAEGMGLQAWGDAESAMVTLEDGTRLQWWDQQGRFVLSINLAYEGDEALRDAKLRADQIWELAVQARQANNVGAVVVQPKPQPQAPMGYAPPPPPGGSTYTPPPPTSAPARTVWPDGSACVSGADCQSGTCVHGRCGSGATMGGSSFGGSGGGAMGGARCNFSSDCVSGNCRGGVCQGGAPGAPCSFSSDCPGGNCRGGVCQGGVAGAPCTFSSDCPSGRCTFGKCQ